VFAISIFATIENQRMSIAFTALGLPHIINTEIVLTFTGRFILTEVILIVLGTLLSIIVMYINVLACFERAIPRCLVSLAGGNNRARTRSSDFLPPMLVNITICI